MWVDTEWPTPPKSERKSEHEARCAEAARVRAQYPTRRPILLERVSSTNIALLDKRKYLVPADDTLGQFVAHLRMRLRLDATKALFLYAGTTLPSCSARIADVYERHRAKDGFLYLRYGAENTFG